MITSLAKHFVAFAHGTDHEVELGAGPDWSCEARISSAKLRGRRRRSDGGGHG